jgi:hypothetical protein
MGPSAPLWFGRGEVALHKERRPWDSTAMMTLVVFTQVRAAEKRKTLVLLWWIDEGTVKNAWRSSLAGSPWGEQLRAYEYTRVRILSEVATTLLL